MKLKKIASLALAGIMAVSMLAGCGEGINNSNSGSSSSEPTTTNVVTAIENGIKAHNGDLEINVTTSQNMDAAIEEVFGSLTDFKVNENLLITTLRAVFGMSDIESDYDIGYEHSNFIDNPDSLKWMNNQDKNAVYKDGDSTWAYAYIPVHNNAFDTQAGEAIGYALRDLENVIPSAKDDNTGSLKYENLDVDYTMYVTAQNATMSDNSVVTYVVAVLKADYSARV